MTEFQRIRREVVFDVLERFPDAGSMTLAKKIYKENPEIFKDLENARTLIRIYRGTHGNHNREYTKIKRYYGKPV